VQGKTAFFAGAFSASLLALASLSFDGGPVRLSARAEREAMEAPQVANGGWREASGAPSRAAGLQSALVVLGGTAGLAIWVGRRQRRWRDHEETIQSLTDRLTLAQDACRQRERQARLGRVLGGLFHDLNHPVQSLGNAATLLLRDDLDAAARDDLRRTLARELAAVRGFMDELRDAAKSEPGAHVPVDIHGALTAVVGTLRDEASAAGVSIALMADANLPRVTADPFGLDRVHRNLILNAIQATAPGGRVVVQARTLGLHVEVSVRDTGSGIESHRLPSLFDAPGTTKPHGLGLGLATSRHLVEQFGGTLAVTSAVGVGSTFTVRLPVPGTSTSDTAA